jgi:4-hydroxy-2-oxoheptanedioate aldolase
MTKSNLKARLKQRKLLHGLFVMVPSPAVVEMIGYAGFDYVILDTEHGAAGTETLENQVRAAEASGTTALVRTVGQTPGEILRVLETGASGILVPHVTTAEQAAAIAGAAHYPPHGIRGMATTARAGRHGMTTVGAHLDQASESVSVIVQIEDAAALPNVPAIARTTGIDAVFIGPADLAISLGFPGRPDHPTVAAAIGKIQEQVREAGQVLAGFARSEVDAKVLAEQGVSFICLSSTLVFSQRLLELAKTLKAQ